VADPVGIPERDRVTDAVVATVAQALRSGQPSAVLVGGSATGRPALVAARRAADAAGARLLCETFPARLERGAGVPAVERLAYLGELAAAQLDGLAHLVLVDATPPASFFAYPDRPSDLVPEGCEVHVLAARGDDALGALEHLADVLGAPADAAVQEPARPGVPTGALTMANVGDVIGALVPEGAIVSDEGNTGGLFVAPGTAGAPPHDWLCLTGGSIGQGLPLGTGAALACPDRKVVCLEADGSAMYTLQALWTQAREQLDVTTVIFNNRSYAVLNFELHRVGAEVSGPKAEALLDLGNPDLDFVALAKGMGVPATRAETAEKLADLFGRAMHEPGPALIEAMIPARL
jgi:acetolactate synthase-1/2/3 large subunit